MTREVVIDNLKADIKYWENTSVSTEHLYMAIKALEQKPIDKSAMMIEIYMQGVNMAGEYQGCWVRFKDIERIVDKYITESEDRE